MARTEKVSLSLDTGRWGERPSLHSNRPTRQLLGEDRQGAALRCRQATPAGHDTVRHGASSRGARPGRLTITQGTATPALAAELHTLEAPCLALLGEVNAARRAALAAQRSTSR